MRWRDAKRKLPKLPRVYSAVTLCSYGTWTRASGRPLNAWTMHRASVFYGCASDPALGMHESAPTRWSASGLAAFPGELIYPE